MVLAFEMVAETAATVVGASLERYRRLGIPAETVSWERIGPDGESVESAPAVRTRDRLDWIFEDVDALDGHISLFTRTAADGWAVHAIVPIRLLGAAHMMLRGTPTRVQGWWIDGDDVHFGLPEIP